MLAAFAAAFGGNTGRFVDVTDAALGLVLVLATRPAAAEGLAFQLVGADLDLDVAVDFGHDIHGGERRLPASVGVERADADQPMDARFALQMAVGVVANDAQGRAADTRFLIAQLIDE